MPYIASKDIKLKYNLSLKKQIIYAIYYGNLDNKRKIFDSEPGAGAVQQVATTWI